MTPLPSPPVVGAATGAATPTNPDLVMFMVLLVEAGTEGIVLEVLAIPEFFGESVLAGAPPEVSPVPAGGSIWAVPPETELIMPSEVAILAGD